MVANERLGHRFIVAKLLISCIPNSRSLTANDLRAAVSELPTGIDDTYHLAMTRIQAQELHLAKLGTQALYWVYFSKRRLTVIELRHALSFQRSGAISKDDLIGEDQIRSACAGLISFVKLKDKRKTVECQFSRKYSVQLLCSNRNSDLRCIFTDLRFHHERIPGQILAEILLGR